MKRFTRGERGSAILFAMLALVFLTVIGLSLAVVSETEMLIGSNEQITQEAFYAAEAGVGVATSQVIVTNSLFRKYFTLTAKVGDNDRLYGDQQLGYVVDFTDVYPVLFDVAPFTGANVGASESHYSGFFYSQVRARRFGWPDADPVLDCAAEAARDPAAASLLPDAQAEQVITLGVYISPLPKLGGEALWESFEKPDNFGCSPEKDDDDYIQKVIPP